MDFGGFGCRITFMGEGGRQWGSLNKLQAIEAHSRKGVGDPELCHKGGAVVEGRTGWGGAVSRQHTPSRNPLDIALHLSRTWLDGEFDWGGTPSKL